jgi:hypothetical protein
VSDYTVYRVRQDLSERYFSLLNKVLLKYTTPRSKKEISKQTNQDYL